MVRDNLHRPWHYSHCKRRSFDRARLHICRPRILHRRPHNFGVDYRLPISYPDCDIGFSRPPSRLSRHHLHVAKRSARTQNRAHDCRHPQPNRRLEPPRITHPPPGTPPRRPINPPTRRPQVGLPPLFFSNGHPSNPDSDPMIQSKSPQSQMGLCRNLWGRAKPLKNSVRTSTPSVKSPTAPAPKSKPSCTTTKSCTSDLDNLRKRKATRSCIEPTSRINCIICL